MARTHSGYKRIQSFCFVALVALLGTVGCAIKAPQSQADIPAPEVAMELPPPIPSPVDMQSVEVSETLPEVDLPSGTGGVPGAQEKGYFSAQVFYATDRASQVVDGKVHYIGSRHLDDSRGLSKLAYGSVEVSIPDSHKRGEIESRSRWKFWEEESPTKHVLVLKINPLTGQAEFASEIATVLSEAGRDDVLVFVHGYNVAFDEAAKRTAQMAYDLEFSGAPILYSWPSRGGFGDYPADEASVQWTAPHFKEFLRFVLTNLQAKNVHLIAHSMGNRAVVAALNGLDTLSLPKESATLKQIILAAPDIDAGVFEQLAANFPGKADRITLYSSSNDKAIIASHKLHKEPRAGGSIVVVEGVDTIDASNVRSDFLNHSYFGNSIIGDITSIIHNDMKPDLRPNLVSSETGDYWKILLPDGSR